MIRLILTSALCIWSSAVTAERVSTAIWEYLNCRNTSMLNGLNPLPEAPEWMRQSNLKCRGLEVFNIDETKLTMDEFNYHWRTNGGPKLLETTFSELEKTSYMRGLPKEWLSKFENYTTGSPLSNLIGLTTSVEKIRNNLSSVDLFSSEEATMILVMSRSNRFISNNKLLLEVMLKRHFARTGRLEIPSALEMVLGPDRALMKHLTLFTLTNSENYINFLLAAHQLITQGADKEIVRVKDSITDRNKKTFLCPDLLDYISFTNRTGIFLNEGNFNAAPSCSEWYDEVATEAAIKLEGIRRAFLSNKNLNKLKIEERIK
jgi:hypothetical protein